MFRRRVGLFAAIVSVGVVAALVLWFFAARGHVAIIDVERIEPGVIQLNVASCLGAPEAAVVDQGGGRYEVEVRTTQSWDRGNACADVIEIAVDPGLQSLEIFDTKRGVVFELPKPPLPKRLDIEGRWEMVEVNGEAVEIGVNTGVIPLIEIEAGFLSGTFGCNAGGGEVLFDGEVLRIAGLASTSHLCGIPDGSEEMVLTERTLVSMLESEGASVTRNGEVMTWSAETDRILFELK